MIHELVQGILLFTRDRKRAQRRRDERVRAPAEDAALEREVEEALARAEGSDDSIEPRTGSTCEGQ